MTKIRVKKSCASCKMFHRRDPDMPWPRAGVPKAADGVCSLPRLDDRTDWRRGSDSCDRWAIADELKALAGV